MKFIFTAVAGCALLILLVPAAYAGQNLAREVAANCKVELDTYCKDVTPGQGRILACLYAFSDKATDQCRDKVLEASEQIRLVGAAISYVGGECQEDINRYCKDVRPGEGRLMRCLETKEAALSPKCKSALKEVGYRD
jgi:hypothetical protein